MNKYLKKGLRMAGAAVSTTLCALTLAYSQPSTEVKPYSLEKAAKIYEEYLSDLKKTKDYLNDNCGPVNYDTILEFNNFLKEHLPYMPNSKEEIENLVTYINNKRESETKYITYEVENEEDKKEYNTLIKDLKEVLNHFPGLNKKDSNIKYNADKVLDEYHNQLTKKLIKNSYESLKKREDQSLSYLIEKEQYTIQDLLAFYTILQERGNLYDTKIEKQRKERKPDINFVNYLEHKKAFKDFLNDVEKWRENKDQSYPYISAGVLYGLYEEIYDVKVIRPRNDTNEKVEKIFPKWVETIEDRNPLKTLIPPWLGIVLTFGAPLAIKEFIIKYTRRKWDDADIIETIFQPFGCFADVFHPFIFPIRAIGVPLALEILCKFSKGRKAGTGIDFDA